MCMYIVYIIFMCMNVLFLYGKRPIHTPLDLSAIFTQCVRLEKKNKNIIVAIIVLYLCCV